MTSAIGHDSVGRSCNLREAPSSTRRLSSSDRQRSRQGAVRAETARQGRTCTPRRVRAWGAGASLGVLAATTRREQVEDVDPEVRRERHHFGPDDLALTSLDLAVVRSTGVQRVREAFLADAARSTISRFAPPVASVGYEGRGRQRRRRASRTGSHPLRELWPTPVAG
jgi:hypothetical protein